MAKVSYVTGCPMTATVTVAAEWVDGSSHGVDLKATAEVKDRALDRMTQVRSEERVRLPVSPAGLLQRIYGLLQRVWLHELQESLLLDGRRILDPHDPLSCDLLHFVTGRRVS